MPLEKQQWENSWEMNRLIIIGASGHGKVVADIAILNGYNDIVFLDDDRTIKECAGFPVIGNSSEAPEGDVFVAIGNAIIRKKLMNCYGDRKQPVLIHPNAVIARGNSIGIGSAIMAGAIINPGAQIGKGVIINTTSSVDHDCIIGDFVHVAVGAHLCGAVSVGNNTWIGAGATVSNNVRICDNCMIGAGAVIVKNIYEPGTYVGVPAKKVYPKSKFYKRKSM